MSWVPTRSLKYKEQPTKNAESPCLILEDKDADPRSPAWRVDGSTCRLSYTDEGNQPVDRIYCETSLAIGNSSEYKLQVGYFKRAYKERKKAVWKAAWRDATVRFTRRIRIVIGSERYTVTRRKPYKVKESYVVHRPMLIKHGKQRAYVPDHAETRYRWVTKYKTISYEAHRNKYGYKTITAWKQVVLAAKQAVAADKVIRDLRNAYVEALCVYARERDKLLGEPNMCRASRNADWALFEPKGDTEHLSVTGHLRYLERELCSSIDELLVGDWTSTDYECLPFLFKSGAGFVSSINYCNAAPSTVKEYDVTDAVYPVPHQDYQEHRELLAQRALNMKVGRIDILGDAFVAVRSLIELRDLPKTADTVLDFYRYIQKTMVLGRKLPLMRHLGMACSAYLSLKFGVQPTAEDVGTLCAEAAGYALSARRGLETLCEHLLRHKPGTITDVHFRQRVGGKWPTQIPYTDSAIKTQSVGQEILFDHVMVKNKIVKLGDWGRLPIGAREYVSVCDATGRWHFDIATSQITYHPEGGGSQQTVDDRLLEKVSLVRALRTAYHYQSVVFAKATLDHALRYLDVVDSQWVDEWMQFTKTSWELFPLSFIVDWFTNTNQIAQSIQNLSNLNIGTHSALVDEVWYSTKSRIYAAIEKPALIYTGSINKIQYFDGVVVPPPSGRTFRYSTLEHIKAQASEGRLITGFTANIGLAVIRDPTDPQLMRPTEIMRYERGPLDEIERLATRPRVRISIDGGKLSTLAAICLSMIGGAKPKMKPRVSKRAQQRK